MKQVLIVLLVVLAGHRSFAQNILPENDFVSINNGMPVVAVGHEHRILSRICVDVNMMAGPQTARLTYSDPTRNYSNPLNTNVSGLKYTKGFNSSFDVEAGYFFDADGRYGAAIGLMYARQSGDLTMDHFHIEYKSVDNFNNVFRQSLTATAPIREKLTFSNFSIPLLFKYKAKITELIGFNADAGFLISFSERVHYNTNAAFDYEAIYQYTGTQGNLVPVYDYSAVPASGDFLLTKSQYLATHTAAGIQDYFNGYRSQGYNVGLGIAPGKSSGSVTYLAGTVGLLLRPSVNIVLSHAISVSAGVYYMYQHFNNNVPSDYKLTDKVGQYAPLASTISKTSDNSYGITVCGSYSFRRIQHVPVIAVEDTSSVPQEEEEKEDVPPPAGGGHPFLRQPESNLFMEPSGESERPFHRSSGANCDVDVHENGFGKL